VGLVFESGWHALAGRSARVRTLHRFGRAILMRMAAPNHKSCVVFLGFLEDLPIGTVDAWVEAARSECNARAVPT
jgi:hypothetical protein